MIIARKIPSKNIYDIQAPFKTNSPEKFSVEAYKPIGQERLHSVNWQITFRSVEINHSTNEVTVKPMFTDTQNTNGVKIESYYKEGDTKQRFKGTASFEIPYYIHSFGTKKPQVASMDWLVIRKDHNTKELISFQTETHSGNADLSVFNATATAFDTENMIVTVSLDFKAEYNELETISGQEQDVYYYLLSAQINGLTLYSVDYTKKQISVGEGNINFENASNELVVIETAPNYYTAQSVLDEQESKYKNGKRTVELLCDFSDYRFNDRNETLAISISDASKPMTFKPYDKCIPYIKNEDGNDVPLDSANGEPTVFSVLNIEYIYDGACWQKLYLQEI